jgi:hypothetical protein
MSYKPDAKLCGGLLAIGPPGGYPRATQLLSDLQQVWASDAGVAAHLAPAEAAEIALCLVGMDTIEAVGLFVMDGSTASNH